MKEPRKEDLLKCFDGMYLFLANHCFGYVKKDERAVAIRKLIERGSKPAEQIDKLADYILKNCPEEIKDESAVEVAIRLIKEKPKVTKAFVEKWEEEWMKVARGRNYDEIDIIMRIKRMLKEVGVVEEEK